ncbi:hypothetical protein BgiMline_029540 [Biomphalaria glabrata]|nr:transmembrane protein 26-like [Biomphalaria glabrata]
MNSCIKKTRRILSVVKALISRGLFVLHGLFCIWRVTVIKRNIIFWSLSGTIPLLVIETFFTLCKKKGREWKWICPSVFLYLATAVPAIWFLELDLMAQRLRQHGVSRRPAMNNTFDVLKLNGKVISIAISLGSEEWCKILEQMLLLILIIGRWLLPKGEITKEQLSQLLLVYIGMAADIIELFEAFKEKTVRENPLLTIVILSLWTASLMQFTLVVTATKSKKSRASVAMQVTSEGCCPVEVISIFISVLLQDGPFLVLRMLLIFRYDVLSYTNIFFTCKNSLVLVLQMYRLFVLFTERRKSPTTHAPPSPPSRYSDTMDDVVSSYSDISPSGASADDQLDDRARRYKRRQQPTTLVGSRPVYSGHNAADNVQSQETDRRSLKTPTPKLTKHHIGTHRRSSDEEPVGKPHKFTRRRDEKEDLSMDEEEDLERRERSGKKKGRMGSNAKSGGEVRRKIKEIENQNQVTSARDTLSSYSEDSDHPGSGRDVMAVTDQELADRRKRLKAKTKSNGKGQRVVSPLSDSSGHRSASSGNGNRSKGQNRGHEHWRSAEKDIRTAMSFANERGKHRAGEQGVYSVTYCNDH